MVVGLTDPGRLPDAIELIRPWLGSSEPNGFVAQEVEYPFLLLAAYRTLLRDRVFDVPEVVALGVEESQNRVKIAATTEAATPSINGRLDDLGVPRQATITPIRARTVTAALELDDEQPDSEIQGGWQIRSGGSLCTLGFGALDPSASYAERFVINSHCTTDDHQYDGGDVTQPAAGDTVIGEELLDPGTYSCGSDQCRHSDAALIDADVDLAFGTIARTVDSTNCDQCSASIEVDTLNPTLDITGRLDHTFENETLHKIGRSTGWSYGGVESTCDDEDLGEAWIRECSDRVDFSVKTGDSGSPVFSLKADGTAELRGIVWGWKGSIYQDGVMSDLHQIEEDLGDLYVYEHPATAEINGPDVVPPSASCQWFGEYDGRPPLSFEWRKDGVLVSTSGNYTTSDTGTSDFTLSFEVTDAKSDTDIEYLNVDVDSGAPPLC